MVKKLLILFIIIVGILIGPGIVYGVNAIYTNIFGAGMTDFLERWVIVLIYIGAAALSGLIFIFKSRQLAEAIMSKIQNVGNAASKSSPAKITSGVIGLIIGLVIASLLSLIFANIPSNWVSVPLMIITYIILGALGWSLGFTGKFDIGTVVTKGKKSEKKNAIMPKILDTSAIIDGRIYDILKTGIFDGEMIIPGFVITELQHLADSSDNLKRQKGRLGLDTVNKMQQEYKDAVRIVNYDFEDVTDVDAKLIRLAIELRGKVVTLDYNLNKVAQVYNVKVFNVNELANALKPILLSGESLRVVIMKDGKEANQGVSYLDDGTMIVVEGAKGMAGQNVEITVTSVLQTAAGRMIFAKI